MIDHSYQDITTNKVYIYNANKFYECDLYFNLLLHPESPTTHHQIPSDVILNNICPTSIMSDYRIEPKFSLVHDSPLIQPACIFEPYLGKLAHWGHDFMDDISWKVCPTEVYKSIINGDLIFATDSSSKNNNESFLWIGSNKEEKRLKSNTGCSQGQISYSYRTESHAVLSLRAFYHHVSLNFPTTSLPLLVIYTKSESFLKQYNKCTQHLPSIIIS